MIPLYDSYIKFGKALKYPQLNLFFMKSEAYEGMCSIHYGDVHLGYIREKYLNNFQDLITRIICSGGMNL